MKITKIAKLPEYIRSLRRDIIALQKQAEKLNGQNHELNLQLKDVLAHEEELKHLLYEKIEQLDNRMTELEHIQSVSSRQSATKPAVKSAPVEERFVDNHLLDQFYMELENNLRGTEDEIKEKQKVHLAKFTATNIDYKKYPVIDIGSGRGEFLDLLHDNNIRGIGVDLNETMVKRSKDKGLEAVYADAVEYLANAKSNSIGGVVGFHIAEHLPFEQLIQLVTEARRALVKGGVLLLETPNPENAMVGAFTFWHDPSHLKPLPPALMEFVAKFRGFDKVEIVRLQPELSESQIKKLASTKEQVDVYTRLFGARDYALVATK